VDNNYLDLGMNKSGFVHNLPSGRLSYGLIMSRTPPRILEIYFLPNLKS
jgi:hypothetical protein